MRADDVRHNRFLMRLMSRNPENLALGILNGHNCLVAGTYKYSLGEYMSAFKQVGCIMSFLTVWLHYVLFSGAYTGEGILGKNTPLKSAISGGFSLQLNKFLNTPLGGLKYLFFL